MDTIVMGVIVIFLLLYARRLVRSARAEMTAGFMSRTEEGDEER